MRMACLGEPAGTGHGRRELRCTAGTAVPLVSRAPQPAGDTCAASVEDSPGKMTDHPARPGRSTRVWLLAMRPSLPWEGSHGQVLIEKHGFDVRERRRTVLKPFRPGRPEPVELRASV